MSFPLTTTIAALALGAGVLGAPSAAQTGGNPAAAADLRQQAHTVGLAGLAPDATAFGPAERARAMTRYRARATETALELGLSSPERLRVKDVVRDADGTVHVRYDRTYAGLDVVAGDLVVHRAPTGGRTVDWASTADLSALGAPRAQVPAPAAADAAAALSRLSPVQAAPQLVVYALGAHARLAWAVTVAGRAPDGGPVREVSYVDADTGTPIEGWSLLEQARGRGHSLYGGQVGLVTAPERRRFVLRDIRRGGHMVRDMHNVTNPARAGSPMTDVNNVWGNGRASNRQSAAVDAAYGAAVTWDYFRQQHRRTGIRNNGRAATSRVHFGRGLDNAFWNDACFCMTYGDGGVLFRPLVSLDVAAHEMTHGITSATANLVYIGESGGLNEATSDIFAALVELGAGNRRDPGDYLVGEKVAKRGGFLRRLDRPAADGVSASCWSPTVGDDDVHQSSGVGNHFFYLLAEGSGAKVINGVPHNSPTCDASTMTGIGRDAAARIWYRALTVYMTSSTGYSDARDATVRAARDLFGAGSTRCNAVVGAWDAVSVPAGVHACTGSPAPSGPNAVANPGFETATGWTGLAGVRSSVNDGIRFAHAGRWFARFNDENAANTDVLEQQVSVPAGAPRLSFQLSVASAQPGPTNVDTFTVEVVDAAGVATTLETFSNAESRFTYLPQAVDLSAFAGQTVTLRFTGTEDATDQTFFLVDDVSVTPN